MYNIENQTVVEKIESYSPCYSIWLENTSTGELYMGNSVFSATSDQQSTSLSDDIELGAICSQSWKIRLNGTDKFLGQEYKLCFYLKDFSAGETTYGDLTNYTYGQLAKMTIAQIETLGEIMEGELIPMGRFICTKCKHSGETSEITVYDRLYFSDKIYTPSSYIKFPANALEIEDDICRQLGMTNGNDRNRSEKISDSSGAGLYESSGLRLATANFDFTIRSIPDGATMREVLSYIASCQGEFGFIDRFGQYIRKWYGNPVKTIDNNTIDVPTLSEKQNKIVGIICKSDSQTFSLGDTSGATGRVLEFENPFMTESLFKSLYHRIVTASSFTWYTAEVYQRLGDPRIDIGDVLLYEQESGELCNIPVTGLAMSFDGGLSANISAVGLSVEEQMEVIL